MIRLKPTYQNIESKVEFENLEKSMIKLENHSNIALDEKEGVHAIVKNASGMTLIFPHRDLYDLELRSKGKDGTLANMTVVTAHGYLEVYIGKLKYVIHEGKE